jgi:hypothetical protein
MILYEYCCLVDAAATGIPLSLIRAAATDGWRVIAVLPLSDPKACGNVEVLCERMVEAQSKGTLGTAPPPVHTKVK